VSSPRRAEQIPKSKHQEVRIGVSSLEFVWILDFGFSFGTCRNLTPGALRTATPYRPHYFHGMEK
jgi:hypothetical protein